MARRSRFLDTTATETVETVVWRTAFYLRLSDEDGENVEQNSLGNQRKICQAYFNKLEDVELVRVFSDNGYTGMSYDRPDFSALYDAVMTGEINCIIVKDVSRFGRHYIMTSEFLQRLFPSMGVRFISVNDDYDSLNPKSDVEGLLLPFKMIVNDSYVKDIAKKIRTSISAKMNAGEYLPSASSILYGYIRNPEMNTLVIDVEAAPIVVRIFEMRAECMSFNQIADTLNKEGVPSPGRLRYMRGVTLHPRYATCQWSRSTIRKFVSEPTYLGQRVHGKIKRDKLGAKKTKRDRSEWQIVENSHPAIISQELYDRVQLVNEAELEKQSHYFRRSPVTGYREIFRDKLFCGDCGSRMISIRFNHRLSDNKPSEIRYQCNEFLYSGRTRCFNHYTREDVLVMTVKNVINSQLKVAARIQTALIAYKKSKRSNPLADQLQAVRLQRKQLEVKIERLIEDLTEGIINHEEYEYAKRKYAEEYDLVLLEEQKVESSLKTHQETVDRAEIWVESLKAYSMVPKLDKAIVDLLIEKIIVLPDNTFHIVLNFKNPYKDFAFLTDFLKTGGKSNGRSKKAI